MPVSGQLVVGEAAVAVRRQLGPTAWAALEALVASGEASADHVPSSVRRTAEVLGISKNAAHRAVRTLVEAGLAEPLQQRTTSGRFLAGIYRLQVPTDVLRRIDPPSNSGTGPARPTGRSTANRRSDRDDASQLTLLSL